MHRKITKKRRLPHSEHSAHRHRWTLKHAPTRGFPTALAALCHVRHSAIGGIAHCRRTLAKPHRVHNFAYTSPPVHPAALLPTETISPAAATLAVTITCGTIRKETPVCIRYRVHTQDCTSDCPKADSYTPGTRRNSVVAAIEKERARA